MNLNHKVVTDNQNNEVKEVKEPGKIKQFIAKHDLTPKKVLKTAGKVAAVAGAAVGGFIIGRVTGKNSDDDDQVVDDFEYIDDEFEDSAES